MTFCSDPRYSGRTRHDKMDETIEVEHLSLRRAKGR